MTINEQIIEFITNEVIPKYDMIQQFHAHELPQNMIKNVEYVFKVKFHLTKEDLDFLHESIDADLQVYYHELGLIIDYIIILSFF